VPCLLEEHLSTGTALSVDFLNGSFRFFGIYLGFANQFEWGLMEKLLRNSSKFCRHIPFHHIKKSYMKVLQNEVSHKDERMIVTVLAVILVASVLLALLIVFLLNYLFTGSAG
jgi:hypothetical protein